MSTATGLPALDNTMGALYLGVIFAMALWGAGCIQTYYYFNRYPRDDWRIKVLVVVVWALDTTHQGLITHSCYTYLVTHYGNPLFLNVIVKSLWAMVIFSGLICLLVQIFLLIRVWKLSHKNIYLIIALGLLVIGEFVSVLVYVGRSATFTSFTEVPRIVNESRSINILGAASDTAIALVLIYLLHQSRTGFKRSETIINRLILFTINTGALTSLCALVSLITITVFPNTFIYITFFVCISKLYTNSLYATLNARRSTHDGTPETDTGTLSMSRMRPRATEIESQAMSKTLNERMLQIKVETETAREGGLDDKARLPMNEAPSESDVETFPYDAKRNFSEV